MKNWQVQPPALLRRLHTERLWRVPTREKILYLTFDDGPVPGVTTAALSVLKQFGAKATFFCVGANVEKYPELYAQLRAEGHSAGNHSYSHLNGWKTDTRLYLDDVARCAAVFPSGLFRPPYGRMKPSQSQRLRQDGYRIVMWDVLSGDYDRSISPEHCLQNVLPHAREGSVIVFHDSEKAKENMLYALPKVLEHFAEQGYRFEALL